MIQLYDEAIYDRLKEAFKAHVFVVPVTEYWGVVAMHNEGRLQMPAICISRSGQTIDTEMQSWVIGRLGLVDRIHKNKAITEQAIPLVLNYNLTLLATRQHDIDELTSEVIFLIVNKPRVTITIPYGSERTVNAQLSIVGDVTDSSARDTFSESGILYQSIVPVRLVGANIFNIEHRNLRFIKPELGIENNDMKEEI